MVLRSEWHERNPGPRFQIRTVGHGLKGHRRGRVEKPYALRLSARTLFTQFERDRGIGIGDGRRRPHEVSNVKVRVARLVRRDDKAPLARLSGQRT